MRRNNQQIVNTMKIISITPQKCPIYIRQLFDIKIILPLIASLMLSAISNLTFAQQIYHQGNVSIMQKGYDGWQILHGSDIVAYGDGKLDVSNLPPAFLDLLDYYAGVPTNQSFSKKLSKGSETTTYGPYITTQWNQRTPFNNEFPTVNGNKVLTGCSTISSAQVLNYYKYCKPIEINGTNTANVEVKAPYISRTWKNEEGGYSFDYSYAYYPDFNKINSDQTELSKFLLAISLAQKAMYAINETSTFTGDQESALRMVYGYDVDYYSDENVMEYIIDAVKAHMPVIVSGKNNSGGGHSYIVDGYNGKYLHFNYGWGGDSDGWFVFENTQYSKAPIEAIVAYPSDGSRVYLKSDVKYLCLKAKDEQFYKKYELNEYGNSEMISVKSGVYDFYFEYPDGSTIAPTFHDAKPLNHDNSYLNTQDGHYGFTRFEVEDNCNLHFYCNSDNCSLSASNFPLLYDGDLLLHIADQVLPMNYSQMDKQYYFNIDLAPGIYDIYFTDQNNKILGFNEKPADYMPETVGYGILSFGENISGDSPLQLKIADYAVVNGENVSIKSTRITITCSNDHVLFAPVWYTAADNNSNCSLTVSVNKAGGGYVTGSGILAKNGNIPISAIPDDGMYFVQWNDGYKNNPRWIYLDQDTLFTAEFAETKPYTVTSTATHGVVNGTGRYMAGNYAELEAVADNGYSFICWSDATDFSNPQRTLLVVSDTLITPIFDKSDGLINVEDCNFKTIHLKGNGKSYELPINADSYSQIDITPGSYQLYFETADGTITAPAGYDEFTLGGHPLYVSKLRETTSTIIIHEHNCHFGFNFYQNYVFIDNYLYDHKFWDINCEKEISNIEVSCIPKSSYFQGESLDLKSGKVLVTYTDNTQEEISMDNEHIIISGFYTNQTGNQTVTVYYYNASTSFDIYVAEKKIENVAIAKLPLKLEYKEQEPFAPYGGELIVTYNDKSTETVTFDMVKISGYDPLKIGTQTINAEYVSFILPFEINVIQKSVAKTSIMSAPQKMVYFETEELDLSGGALYVLYDNGTDETISLDNPNVKVSGFNSDKIGRYELKIEYMGITNVLYATVIQNPSDPETPVSELNPQNSVKIWSFEKTVFVENAESEILIADMSGRIVKIVKPENSRMEIRLSNGGVYIVKTGLKTQKIIIR